jgi:serine/threonine-protein kinase
LQVKRAEANDDNVPSGDVVRIDTGTAGTGTNHLTVPKGTPVTMVVSKGPVMVRVPPVRFKSLSEAEDLLASVGLKVHVNKPLGFGNTVVASSPGEKSLVAHGTTVTLIVAF